MVGPVGGSDVNIGTGFKAKNFRAQDFGPAMDPLVMVDHYEMTEPTFGTHPHAGLSAVSLILDDSKGRFHNRDSLGNDFDLLPGDLYWMQAGRGALHNESPREGSRTHGLQVFVNVPQANRHDEPSSLLVRRMDMPLLKNDEHHVRVVLGQSNGVVGAQAPGLPMTILDGRLAPNGHFIHRLSGHRNAWVHVIAGELDVSVATGTRRVRPGQAIAMTNAGNSHSIAVRLLAVGNTPVQFVLFDGLALKEFFVQQGPFVMGSMEEIESAYQAHNEGRFGSID